MGKAKTVEVVGRQRVAGLELAHRIARAKAKMPPQDPTGEHHASIADIARRSGRDIVELLDLWDERAAIRQYEGCADRATAELGAVTDIEALFAPAQGEVMP